MDGAGAVDASAVAEAFMPQIRAVRTLDRRFPLAAGSGTDAVHGNPDYSYAVTQLICGELASATAVAIASQFE